MIYVLLAISWATIGLMAANYAAWRDDAREGEWVFLLIIGVFFGPALALSLLLEDAESLWRRFRRG
jgi:hypothetical protein